MVISTSKQMAMMKDIPINTYKTTLVVLKMVREISELESPAIREGDGEGKID